MNTNIKSTSIALTLLAICLTGVSQAQPFGRWLSFDDSMADSSAFPGRSAIDKKSSPTMDFKDHGKEGVDIDYRFPGGLIREKVHERTTFHHIDIDRFGKMGSPGKPALPVRYFSIAVPDGMVPELEMVNEKKFRQKGFLVHPALEPAADKKGAPEPAFALDAKTYTSEATYPEAPVSIQQIKRFRGRSIAQIRVCPVLHCPANNELITYSRLHYKMTFKRADSPDSGQTANIALTPLQAAFLENIAGNASITGEMAESATEAPLDIRGGGILILTHPNYAGAADTLAFWKKLMGYDVTVIAKPDWDTVRIKDTIEAYYSSSTPPIDFVVFLGDHPDVPSQLVGGHVTDLYYACMDGAGDFTPDIATGRISVSSSAEAMTVVKKIVNYERNPVSTPAFYQRGLAAAYFQHAGGGYAERRFAQTSWEIEQYLIGQGYAIDREFYTESSVYPTNWNNGYYSSGEPIPTVLQKPNYAWDGDAAGISASINAGRFLVSHRDHGGETVWGDPYYTTSNINALSNGNLLPVVFSINCLTGRFDYSSPCFSEVFLRHPNGGAVGVVCATEVSYSGQNDGLAEGLMDAIWPTPGLVPLFPHNTSPSVTPHSPMTHMGLVLNQGKFRMSQTWNGGSEPFNYEQYTYELFHFLGDPSMQIWTDVPQDIAISAPDAIMVGQNTLSITGASCPDGFATLLFNNEVIGGCRLVSGSGTIALDPAPMNVGTLSLTVTAHNFRPLTRSIAVIPPGDAIFPSAPAAGTLFDAGEAVHIAWQTFGTIPRVTIQFSQNNGASYTTVAQDIDNSGEYQWIAPSVESDSCVIRVLDVDGSPSGVSPAFRIHQLSAISGTVLGGAPAQVVYNGPVSGVSQTGSDGAYSIDRLWPGTYALYARTGGFVSDTIVLAVPPDRTEIDFAINYPRITVRPSLFNVMLDAGDSAFHRLSLLNQGTAALSFSISGSQQSSPTDAGSGRSSSRFSFPEQTVMPAIAMEGNRPKPPVEGLSIPAAQFEAADLTGVTVAIDAFHGARDSVYFTVALGDLKMRGAQVFRNTSQISAAMLDTVDVLWCGDYPTVAYSTAELAAIDAWLANGGGLLVQSDEPYYHTTLLQPYGITHTSGGTSGTTTNIVEHPSTDSVFSVYCSGPMSFLSLSQNAQAVVFDIGNQPHACVAEVGKGRIFVVSDEDFEDSYIGNAGNRRLVNQAIDWISGNSSRWLSWAAESGTVVPGDSAIIVVGFRTENLLGGRYAGEIRIAHNAPASVSPVVIPCSLSVNGYKRLEAVPATCDFGDVQVGSSDTVLMTLRNGGNEATVVMDVTVSRSVFSSTSSIPLSVPAFGEIVLPLVYTPDALGPDSGDLTILSDAEDHPIITLPLSGQGVPAPEISVMPQSISRTLNSGGVSSVPLHIANPGGLNLTYGIQGSEGLVSGEIHDTIPGTQSRAFLATHTDLYETYWSDAGNDAFDGFGYPQVSIGGSATNVSMLEGTHAYTANGYRFRVRNDFAENHIYRMLVEPDSGETASRSDITVYLSGNMGSDGSEINYTDSVMLANHEARKFYVNEVSFPSSDPRVVFMIVPARPDQKDSVRYWESSDNVYLQARNISLPAAVYIIPSYYHLDSIKTWFKKEFEHGVFPSWLSASPEGGTVLPGDSQQVLITLDARNMLGGTYVDTIRIAHNAPQTTSPLSVPCTLVVDGMRRLSLTPQTVDFGSCWVGLSDTAVLTLTNSGDEPTLVSSVSSTNGNFSNITSLPLTVPAFGSTTIRVRYQPGTIGSHSGTLTITSNAEDNPVLTVGLTGSATLPPSIAVTPDRLLFSLEPGQSRQSPVLIQNSGGDDLDFSIQAFGQGGNGDTIDILAWTPYTDMTGEWVNMQSAMAQHLARYTVATSVTFDSTALESALVSREVFLIPEQETGSVPAGTGTRFRGVLSRFLQRGGTIICCSPGFNATHTFLSEAQLMSLTYLSNSSSGTVTLTQPGDSLFSGINGSLYMVNATTYCQVNDNSTILGTYSGYMVVAKRALLSGQVVALGSDFYTNDANWGRILCNAVLTARPQNSWLTLSSTGGSIQPGSQQAIIVTVNAADLDTGTYQATLSVAHNDPIRSSPIQVPVTLQVYETIPGLTGRILSIGTAAQSAVAGTRFRIVDLRIGSPVAGQAQGTRFKAVLR